MLRQESEGEVTQRETECFERSDRVYPEPVEGILPGEPFQEEKVALVCIVLSQDLTPLRHPRLRFLNRDLGCI